MATLKKADDRVLWFMSELGARVVAETGIPSDRHHLGKLTLRSFKDAPDFILQIDAGTEESEDFKSALKRSIQCAIAFKELGLKTGDNIVLMTPNNIHLNIPFYAALFLGLGITPLDITSTSMELQPMFKMIQPKVIFCQKEKEGEVLDALLKENLKSIVIGFEDSSSLVFSKLIETYGDAEIQNFVASDFDPAETLAVLLPTSGSTGLPKTTALTHKNLCISLPTCWVQCTEFPTPTRIGLVASPLQWLTGIIHFICSPLYRYTRVQTSQTVNAEVLVPIINKYKPTYMIISPPLLTALTKPENISRCDMSCFEHILIGGSAVSKELVQNVQAISSKINVRGVYGMSEVGGFTFWDQHPPAGSMGRPVGIYDYRLINPDTLEDITEPHVTGELWLRGPSVCKGYYNQPEATKECFLDDGWLRTGDMFYRDDNYFFYFSDRLKMLLKYKNHQISPLELETVIRQHPAVLDVAVTGIPDPECGDLPVACVVPKHGSHVTAQDIKDMVKNSLTDTKQLRGGVVFMKEFPMTASTKLHRRRLKEMMATATRE